MLQDASRELPHTRYNFALKQNLYLWEIQHHQALSTSSLGTIPLGTIPFTQDLIAEIRKNISLLQVEKGALRIGKNILESATSDRWFYC